MNVGKSVFAQLMSLVPWYEFGKCVDRYGGDYKVQKFTTRQQFLVMCLAQLTRKESLRDIESRKMQYIARYGSQYVHTYSLQLQKNGGKLSE